jgi:chloramphenicol O-acetyltransferase
MVLPYHFAYIQTKLMNICFCIFICILFNDVVSLKAVYKENILSFVIFFIWCKCL